MKASLLILAASVSAFAAVPDYKLVDQIHIGGEARWDYLYMDGAAHRLYVSHGSQTEVVDTESRKLLASIKDTPGVHGIAVASDLGLGFISNGKGNSVTIFDLASLKTLDTIRVGQNPDAIVYDAANQRVITFNGRSNDLTIVDAKSKQLVATVPVGGKPEFAQVGAGGNIYFNLEDKNEMVVLDPKAAKIVQHFPLSGCDGPSGLAVDTDRRTYSVCGNLTMSISMPDGKKQFSAPIGAGPDGVAWMDGYAFSANGRDGNISMVAETAPDKFERVAEIPSGYGARTIAADPLTHRLYLPTADFKPAETGTDGKSRRQSVPDTFHILVIERQ